MMGPAVADRENVMRWVGERPACVVKLGAGGELWAAVLERDGSSRGEEYRFITGEGAVVGVNGFGGPRSAVDEVVIGRDESGGDGD